MPPLRMSLSCWTRSARQPRWHSRTAGSRPSSELVSRNCADRGGASSRRARRGGSGWGADSLAARAPVPVRLAVDLEERVPERVEVAAYYVVCESLANVAKHARATSATVNVAQANGQVVVEVVDDGVGGADTERGSGLRGLADRVEALGGRLRIWTPVGGGTRVRAEMPC